MLRILSLFALLLAVPARAEWWEAKTDNFIVYSESSAADAKQFAEKLERFDQSLRSLQKIKLSVAPSDTHRLTVYRFGDYGDIGRLHGTQGVAGFYIPRLGGPVAFTPAKELVNRDRSLYGQADRRTTLDAQTVLFHEYAHHFMFKHFTAAYPAWYVEGLAETYSTLDLRDDGSFHLGNPPQARSDALFSSDFNFSIQRLLTNRRKPEIEDQYGWYTYGWLLTHYLTFEPKRTGQIGNYLRLINEGVDTAAAATQAFGDLGRLDADVTRYKGLGRQGKLPGVLVRPTGLNPPTAALRALDEAEEAAMAVQLRSNRGVSRKVAAGVAADARAVAAKYPASYAVQRALVEAEFDAQNYDASERAAQAALAARPNAVDPLYYLGQIYLERAKSDPSKFATARSWFAKANQADPHHPGPLLGNYLTYAKARAPIPENAVLGLERAYELAPYDSDLRLVVASQLLAEKKGDIAKMLLVPLALSPHDKRSKAVDEAVDLINAGKIDAARSKLASRLAEEEAERDGKKKS